MSVDPGVVDKPGLRCGGLERAASSDSFVDDDWDEKKWWDNFFGTPWPGALSSLPSVMPYYFGDVPADGIED